MYGLHEALSRERSAEWRRRSSRHRLGEQVAASRRLRRRAESARRGAEAHEARADQSARSDYDLAGR